MKLKLGGFTRNREAVRGKLRLAKNTLSERERELLRVQNELRQAAKSGDTSTDYKFVVDTAADKLKESKEDVRVLRAQLGSLDTEVNRASIDVSNMEKKRATLVQESKDLQAVHGENMMAAKTYTTKHERIAAALQEHSDRVGMGKYAVKSHSGKRLRMLRATLQWQMAEDDFKVALERLATATERLEICNARLMKKSKTPGVSKIDIATAREEQSKADALVNEATRDMDAKREILRRKKEQAYLMGHGDPMPDPNMRGDVDNATGAAVSAAEEKKELARKEVEAADLKVARRKSHMLDMRGYLATLKAQMLAMKKKLAALRKLGGKRLVKLLKKIARRKKRKLKWQKI